MLLLFFRYADRRLTDFRYCVVSPLLPSHLSLQISSVLFLSQPPTYDYSYDYWYADVLLKADRGISWVAAVI